MKRIIKYTLPFILSTAFTMYPDTGYTQNTDELIWQCYSDNYDSLDIDIKAELDQWQEYLVSEGHLKKKNINGLIKFINNALENFMFTGNMDCEDGCTNKDVKLKIDEIHRNGQAIECLWNTLKSNEPDQIEMIQSHYKENYQGDYKPEILLSIIETIGKSDISKDGYYYPILEMTYRLSFDKAYLLAIEEREQGLTPAEIHGSPTLIMEALFKAAKTEDLTVLKYLCDPYGFGDGDTKQICNLSSKDEIIAAFKEARITGNIRQWDNTSAEVPFVFSEGYESMKVVKYGNMWFLSSF